MKPEILFRIFREKKVLTAAAVALMLLNTALYAYVEAWAKPGLEVLFRTWNEKRTTLSPGAAGDVAATYRQGVQDLALFRERIPEKPQFARLMMDIFELASKRGVTVGGIQYQPEKPSKSVTTSYGVTLISTGSYRQVKAFLADLSLMREMVVVESLAISRRGESDQISLQTQLTVFLQMEKQ